MSGSAKSGANMICDFTSGSIPQQMLRFSLPFMFSNVLQIVYSLVDMAVVGQYVGKEGLAAVSIASEVCNFMTMSCMGVPPAGRSISPNSSAQGARRSSTAPSARCLR